MKQSYALCISIATLACCVTLTHEAKADFTEDAKDIIEQLIENNISTQVVPNAAAKFPVICDLFPASIWAIKAQRYNGFPAIARKELADAAGLLIVVAIQNDRLKLEGAPGLHDQSIKLLTKLVKETRAPQNLLKDDVRCTFVTEETADKDKVSLAPGQSVATQVLRTCANTQDSAIAEIACSVGVAVRDAADGGDKLLAGDAQRLFVAFAAAAALHISAGASDTAAAEKKQLEQAISFINQVLADKAITLDVAGTGLDAEEIKSLAKEISVAVNTSSATIEQLLGTASAFSNRLGARPHHGVLDKVTLDAISKIANGSYSVIKEIQAKNYGQAASAAFDAVDAVVNEACSLYDPDSPNYKYKNGLPTDQEEKAKAEKAKKVCDDDTNEHVRQFLVASAVYAIDSATVGNPNSPNSSNFRAAAVKLIEDSSGAGVRRRTFCCGVPGFVLPSFALRDAVRPGHIGTTPGALLFYPSIDWPNIRIRPFYTSRLYWGFDVSFLDAVGPFMEIANRDTALKNDANTARVFGLGFVVPRVEFEFGVPELTKNLVVGVGGAFRFFRAEISENTPKYCLIGQSGCAGIKADNFEGSVFVKYVP